MLATSEALETTTESQENNLESSENATELRTQSFLNPLVNSSEKDETPPSESVQQTPSEPIQKHSFKGLKIDGEVRDVELTQQELEEHVRKGATFFKRMSELDNEKRSIEAEKNQPLSDDEIELRSQVNALKKLKTQSPQTYAELINNVNQSQIEASKPRPSALEDEIGKLEGELTSQYGDSPVLSKLTSLFRNMATEMKQREESLLKQVSEVKETTDTLGKFKADVQQKEKDQALNEQIVQTREFLVKSGLSEEDIAAKAGLVQAYHRPEISLIETAKLVYALEIDKAKANNIETNTPKETSPQAPTRKAGPPKFLGSQTNGAPPQSADQGMSSEEKIRQKELALFGRELPKI